MNAIYANLGTIEYLRNYPHILDHIIFRSRDKSLEPFIEKNTASVFRGGFYWRDSEEGFHFWKKILSKNREDIDVDFYNTLMDINEDEF